MQEIDWLTDLAGAHPDKIFEVGIRANFNLEKMCPGETTMGEVSGRFGFCYETGKFAEALKILRSLSNVSVTVCICIPAANPGASISSVPLRRWHVS